MAPLQPSRYREDPARQIDGAIRALAGYAFERAVGLPDMRRQELGREAEPLLNKEALVEEDFTAFAVSPPPNIFTISGFRNRQN
jgi:hypothetical protein